MEWFTGDLHCAHTNVMQHCNRPFLRIEEHDQVLVNNWNDVVQPKDHVYVLGDFVWKDKHYALKVIKQLKGKIHFLKGNHDRGMKGEVLNKIEVLPQYYELTIQDKEANGGKQLICLFHYPIESWNKKHFLSWHLHAHCHTKIPSVGIRRLDVGVDSARNLLGKYRPFSYDEVKVIMQEKMREDFNGTRSS
jgi:calcineurin-like phosphoesterase family protein